MEFKKSGVGRNVAVMAAASIASAITGAILMFWVPRLMSVNDFGYWRTFLLYAGFTGFVHLGLADGALLHWSQSKEPQLDSGLKRATLILLLQHLCFGVLVLFSFLLPAARKPHIHTVLTAVLIYAWAFNLLGLAQVKLQAQGRFRIVAIAMTAPGILFLLFLAIFHSHFVSVKLISFLFLMAWSVVAGSVWLTAQFSTRHENRSKESFVAVPRKRSQILAEGLWHVQAGWPIMLANTSYGLMQSADRITVNSTRPIHDFAIYSLAQSTIYVPVTIVASISRVAFSHFAKIGETDRSKTYRKTVQVLTFTWALLLPYYYLAEWIVQRFLPQYVSGLAAGRVLLLSVLFLSLISIAQANAWSLAGRQRQFFAGSVVAMAFAFLTAWIGSRFFGSLTAVAWSQVISAAAWWLGNEAFMRPKRFLAARDISLVVLVFVAGTIALYWSAWMLAGMILRPVLYYLLIFIPMLIVSGQSFRDITSRLRWTK